MGGREHDRYNMYRVKVDELLPEKIEHFKKRINEFRGRRNSLHFYLK